jgi:hypothetical protein
MTDFKEFKKGDVIAIIETRVTQFVFGSGRPAETSHSIRIVRIESASRDGRKVKSYRPYPGAPVFPYRNSYNRIKLMTIQSGTLQQNARRLWNTATYFLDFDSQDAAKKAILEA